MQMDRIAELAIAGARDDPREDKTDWIRIWVAARRHRQLPVDSATWKQHYLGDKVPDKVPSADPTSDFPRQHAEY